MRVTPRGRAAALSGFAVLVLAAVGLYGAHRYSVHTLELQGVAPRA